MSVSNQRIIYVQRESENARKDYFKISNENLRIAMFNLNTNALKLYLYLCSNANGYKMDLYPCEFSKDTGAARSTYNAAFKRLVDKGYLIKSPKQSNLYLFREVSEIAELPKSDTIESLDKEDFESIKAEYFDE